MSDFADRIRDARRNPRPDLAAAPHPELEPTRPRLVPDERALAAVEPPAPPSVPRRAELGPSAADELAAQQRRIEALSRKIDDLNAAILHEILRQPGGAEQYPRTLAALADELTDRAADAG
jgi:hypothetical protein